jgi:Fe-S cluster biogenesis protein NfuA
MVNTELTPNPESLKFFPAEQKVLTAGTLDFPDARSATKSPLAKLLFKQEGVKRVFLTSDFVTITKDENIEWEHMKPVVIGTLMEFYASGQPAVLDEKDLPQDTKILDTDSESVAMIKELLETRIRPAVQDDGGDITLLGFHEGVVFLLMQGSCSGCPSSSVTLKSGIERMLMHWVPEVQGVMAMDSREEYERVVNRVVHTVQTPAGTPSEEILQEAKHQSEARKANEDALESLESRLKHVGDGQGKM